MIKAAEVEIGVEEGLLLYRAMTAALLVCMRDYNNSEDDGAIFIGAASVLRRTLEWVEEWHAEAWAEATNATFQRMRERRDPNGGSGGR